MTRKTSFRSIQKWALVAAFVMFGFTCLAYYQIDHGMPSLEPVAVICMLLTFVCLMFVMLSDTVLTWFSIAKDGLRFLGRKSDGE